MNVIALAEELSGVGGGAELDAAMAAVTSYANDLGVETGVQSGGIAPYAELTDEQASHVREAYAAGLRLDAPDAEAGEYVVELYRGESPGAIGTSLEDWGGELDADTTAWLTGQGWGTDEPDLWVNIRTLPGESFAPNNHPIATRTIDPSA